MKRLIQEGDSVYMIDEECMKKKEQKERQKEMSWQKTKDRTKQKTDPD